MCESGREGARKRTDKPGKYSRRVWVGEQVTDCDDEEIVITDTIGEGPYNCII